MIEKSHTLIKKRKELKDVTDKSQAIKELLERNILQAEEDKKTGELIAFPFVGIAGFSDFKMVNLL